MLLCIGLWYEWKEGAQWEIDKVRFDEGACYLRRWSPSTRIACYGLSA